MSPNDPVALAAADFADSLASDCATIGAIVANSPLESPVPACPGWTLADLAFHCAQALELWSQIIERKIDNLGDVQWTSRPDDAGVAGFFAAEAKRTQQMLRDADPAQEAWTFWGPRDVSFLRRRITHEIAVHRVDAQSATGREPEPIGPVVAADGIDEWLALFNRAQPEGSIHVHCTDTNGEWLMVRGPERVIVTREHAKGDAAMRGCASDLLLVLWNRRPLHAIEVLGDAPMVQRFLEASRT